MKNGMAMISNFSIPVNLRATGSNGTWVKKNMKVTVRPKAKWTQACP